MPERTLDQLTDPELVALLEAEAVAADPHMAAMLRETARRLREFGCDADGWPLWSCPGCSHVLGTSDMYPGERVCDNCDYHSAIDEEYR